jgi:GNAT superfamily N-acetyltransferase
MPVSVVPLDRSAVPSLLQMWRGYQEFYQINDIDDARNRDHVELIFANPALGRIHLAVTDGQPIGFSTVYYTFTSTRSCKIALLNDLYVTPERRRAGVGRALIEQAIDHARSEGIRYVRWSTAAGNVDAQRLYDAYGTPTLWKTYSVEVPQHARR